MSASLCSASALVAPQTKAFTGLRSTPAVFASKPAGFAAVRRSVKPQRKAVSALQSTSSLVEFAQVANEAGFIGGVASTMIGMTLLGLAIGFVILRVEALVEEGKL